jgi:uncharacterized membrane protein
VKAPQVVTAEHMVRGPRGEGRTSSAGWFLLIGQMTEDKFLAAVSGTQATLVRSNLSHEQEEELKLAFGTEKHAND